MSNVHQKGMPLAGYLNYVTMQKNRENLRKSSFSNQKAIETSVTSHIERKNTDLSPWGCPQLIR